MTAPLFQLDKVSLGYDGKQVLDVDRLEMASGRIFALLGPNGCGKSTLLRALDILDRPLAGSLRYDGHDLSAMGEAERLQLRRSMVMVLQRSYMFNDSVFGNIAYALKIRGLPAGEIKARIGEALDFVDLAGFAQRDARHLSGGETQRVAIARAIALRPRVLFLDEPTASLDPENVALVEDLIVRIRQTYGTTVVLVTHNLFQARRVAEEGIFLCQGHLVEHQTMEGIFQDPRSELTRQFVLGTMVY